MPPLPISEISGLDDLGPIQGAKPAPLSHALASELPKAYRGAPHTTAPQAVAAVPVDSLPAIVLDAPSILESGAATFRERNKFYGENWRLVAPVMRQLFPDGVPADLLFTDRWHMFELIVIKLTRFATSGLTHVDSIHDAMVYSAMVEASLREGGQ